MLLVENLIFLPELDIAIIRLQVIQITTIMEFFILLAVNGDPVIVLG